MSLENQNGYKNRGIGIHIGCGDMYIPSGPETQREIEHVDYHRGSRNLGIAAIGCSLPEMPLSFIKEIADKTMAESNYPDGQVS